MFYIFVSANINKKNMSNSIFEKIENILEEIKSAPLASAEEMEAFRATYVGNKNILKGLFAHMKDIEPSRKKDFGQLMNTLKTTAQERYDERLAQAKLEQRKQKKASEDLTRPAIHHQVGARHPVSIVLNQMVDVFAKIGFVVSEDREIEDDWHNFTAMNTPEDHPARDMQDTFYLSNSIENLLRTHTSSVQSRVMTAQKPPIRIIAPGRVYRNETVSARSHCQFHQVEGLYIDKNVSFADMKQTLLYFAQEMYGADTKIRLRPSYFPFTEPSAEMDVWMGTDTPKTKKLTKGTGWLEVLGCGMVDPNVLTNCGIDASVYSGFAFGIGIERSAMQKYDIGDIRMLFENDIRFLKQFQSAL